MEAAITVIVVMFVLLIGVIIVNKIDKIYKIDNLKKANQYYELGSYQDAGHHYIEAGEIELGLQCYAKYVEKYDYWSSFGVDKEFKTQYFDAINKLSDVVKQNKFRKLYADKLKNHLERLNAVYYSERHAHECMALGELYEQIGEHLLAAECYLMLDKITDACCTFTFGGKEKARQLYLNLGLYEKVLEHNTRCTDYIKDAIACEMLGRYEEAMRYYTNAKMLDKALEMRKYIK